MNPEDYEHAMDAQLASTHADWAMFERGRPVADLVEPVPPDFLSDLLSRFERWDNPTPAEPDQWALARR